MKHGQLVTGGFRCCEHFLLLGFDAGTIGIDQRADGSCGGSKFAQQFKALCV
jgi:hypothetical protein